MNTFSLFHVKRWDSPWVNAYSPLGRASYEGNIELVKQLLAEGTDANVKGIYDDMTPLHLTRNEEIAKILIQAGADVNRKALWYKRTPLHYTKSAEFSKLLIQAGADVNAKDVNDDTPLHWATSSSNMDPYIVQCLIEAGADVNAVNKQGDTPLINFMRHYEYMKHFDPPSSDEKTHAQITKLFMLHGADPFIKNCKEENAYDLAIEGSLTMRCLNVFKFCRSCWEIWEMNVETFEFYLQWLPEEVNADVMNFVFNELA